MKKCVYMQIVERVRRDCELGLYGEGGRLPSCRDLAMRLGVNPNTVQRAYSQLENDGYISSSPKKGYFAVRSAESSRELAAMEKLESLRAAGFTKEELEDMISKLYGGSARTAKEEE